MLPGDFVFFRINGKLAHIGIYVGNNEFIHSPARNQYIRIDKLEAFWADTFYGAKKLYRKESAYRANTVKEKRKRPRDDRDGKG
ncbi:MAG: C40 family peptidase [Spirochaetales bacterium]|nr:C40 family peptidase [Spirochaetales bacterium]